MLFLLIAVSTAIIASLILLVLLIYFRMRYRLACAFFALIFMAGLSIGMLSSGFGPLWIGYAVIVGIFFYFVMLLCWRIVGPALTRNFDARF